MRTLIALLMTLLLTGCGAAAMTMVTGSQPPAASAPETEAAEVVRFEVEKQPFEWRKLLGLAVAVVGFIVFKWKDS